LEFARTYELPVKPVVRPAQGEASAGEPPYEDYGVLFDSGPFSGLTSEEALRRMPEHARAQGFGAPAVSYRLRDWLISRQRYWGTPIPVVYCEKDGVGGVPGAPLPVTLPPDAPFTGEGGNPLEKVPSFVNAICPRCGGPARGATGTLDALLHLCWY